MPAPQKKSTAPAGVPTVQEVRPGSQVVSLYEIGELGGHRYLLEVRWDTSYDFQSSGKVSVWSSDALSWQPVASLFFTLMRSRPRREKHSVADFADDRAELLRRFAVVVCP